MAADRWQIQIATSDNFAVPLYDETVFTQSFTPIADLDPSTTYYWRVRAGDGVDWSGWSAVWSFATQAGIYTDELASVLSSVADISDRQHYRATLDVLAQVGVSASDARALVEAVISLAQTQASPGAAQAYRDAETTVAASSAGAQDAQVYRDQLDEVIIGIGEVDDQKQGLGAAETLLTVATTAAQASAAQAYVEAVTAIAAVATDLAEAIALVEQLGSTSSSISSMSERQLFFDNVAIVALSTASLAEIGVYIDEVGSVGAASASLTDVLVGSFVGRYLLVDYCRPRSFEDFARPRNFVDYCRPRGRTLQ